LDKVEITSETLVLRVLGVKMAAKDSSVMILGKLWVTEMGRWREKKVDSPRTAEALPLERPARGVDKGEVIDKPSFERCCVLGTTGSCFVMDESFAFLLRRSPVGFAFDDSASDDFDSADDAGTDCRAEISFDPLSGLDGFEEEHRLWWHAGRPDRARATRGPEDKMFARAGG
jgi:hypothetical protein